jgi:hypothetical protein
VPNNCGTVVDCGPCAFCRAARNCDCPPGLEHERSCVINPTGVPLPSCVCVGTVCRFDGPPSSQPTRCCSCEPV